ncbi:MAG TPA: hypothetical protein DCQ64_31035 [Candidatus Rokubacteria bacterium]|nr:hypothetical protein [Candidatus Rokubacteria bacterium]
MTDEVKLRQQADRGARAKRLLDDELVREAFGKIGAAVQAGWENSEAGDHEGRHNAYLMHRLLKNFKAAFERIVITGGDAQKELLRIEATKKRRSANAR